MMIKTIVILCSHNGEKFIKEQLDSILDQTTPVSSIHIHDYNSSDKTREKIKKLENKTKNIYLKFFSYAKGPTHSFLNSINIVKKEEQGDCLIYLVDQDDIWLPNKNEEVLKEHALKKFDVAFHDVNIVDSNLKIISKSYYGRFWNAKRDLKFPNQLYSNCVIGHTSVYDINYLNEIDLSYDPRIPIHDWYLINEAIFLNKKIHFIENYLSLYRQHDNNLLGSSVYKKRNYFKKLKNISKKLSLYHNLLEEKGIEIKKFRLHSARTILKNIKPLEKALFILVIKFFIKNDKIQSFRKQ